MPTEAADGLKSALGGATDAVNSAQDAAAAAAGSLAEGIAAAPGECLVSFQLLELKDNFSIRCSGQ